MPTIVLVRPNLSVLHLRSEQQRIMQHNGTAPKHRTRGRPHLATDGTGERPRGKYVPKGTYQGLADSRYLSKRDEVNDYAPRMLSLILRLKNVDQETFANQMGLSVSALRDRLRGKTSISAGELAGICLLLEVPIKLFLDRSISMEEILDVQNEEPR